MHSHCVENRQDPCTSAKSGGPRQPDIPRKERPPRLGHKRNCQFQIPTQLAKFSSRTPTHHNTTTAPMPLHLGSNTDCCASAIALLDCGPRRGLTVAAASGIFMGKNHPPALVPGSKCPLPIEDPSIARAARCPERPVRSRGSRISKGVWGPCTALTQVQHVE